MNTLHFNQISYFSVLGLKAICSINRDIFLDIMLYQETISYNY